MNNKMNDLFKDKKEQIDMTPFFSLQKVIAKNFIGKKIEYVKDIYKKRPLINLSRGKKLQFLPNKTKNFDGLSLNSDLKDISLVKEKQDPKKSMRERKFPKISFEKKGFLLIVFLFLFLYLVSGRYIVEYEIKSGYQRLISLKDSKSDIDVIQSTAAKARLDFYIARFFFIPYYLIPTTEVENGKNVINGGIKATRIISDAFYILDETQEFIAKKGLKEIQFSQLLANLEPTFQEMQKNVDDSINSYKKLQLEREPELQKKINEQIKNLETIRRYILTINSNYSTILEILGHTKQKRYLIVFQNSDEIRPTGGFMGSMAILDLFRGKVQNFEQKDVYDLEWNLKKSEHKRLPPPEGINKITDSFGLRDANYFINPKESAKNIKFFVDKAGYPIDGVLFLNQNIISDILEVVGPVYFKDIDEYISSKNFSELMSILVESKKFKSGTLGTPKKVLFDFSKVFLQKIQEEKAYREYFKIFIKNLDNREVLFETFQPEEDIFLEKIGLTGFMKLDTTFDFNYPVFTSISGNKSDRYIERSFEKYLETNKDCSYNTVFRIKQAHTFTQEDEKRVKDYFKKYDITDDDGRLLSIQGKGKNWQYVRVILPIEAQIKNKNVVVENYKERKSVNFYMETLPGKTSIFDIEYTLPNPDCKKYSFKLYKQPGIPDYDVKFEESGIKSNTYISRKEDFYYEVRK